MFTCQLLKHCTDIVNLNYYGNEILKDATPSVIEAVTARIQPINETWNKLLLAVNKQEVCIIFYYKFKKKVYYN